MITDAEQLNRLTEKVIGLAYTVANGLGHGFAEDCYENAMVFELRAAGHKVLQQEPLKVWYKNVAVGAYKPDLLVDDILIIELKAVERLHPAHAAQCLNYLAATRLPLCLLINFASRVEIKRIAGPALRDLPSVSISAPSVAKK